MSIYTKGALALITLLTAFRLAYCTSLDILPDEAYYYQWAQHLDASYYSKGPAIAWTIALGTWIFGDTVFGIRWISVCLAAGTGWLLFLLTRRLFNARTGFLVVCVAATIPLFAVGSVLMTIDPLSVFFWIAASYLFLNAIEGDRISDWMLVGLMVGCGFLAKYVNALELVSFFLFLVWAPRYRKHLKNPKIGGLLGVFFLCTLPVLYWNHHHGWITLTHLQERGQLDSTWNPSWHEFFQFFLQQALVLSPGLFILIFTGIFLSFFKKKKGEAFQYLLALWAPVFFFYTLLAFQDSGEANWIVTSYLGALPLAVAFWQEKVEGNAKWKFLVYPALALALLQTILLHETWPLHFVLKKDPLDRVRGWTSFGEAVDAFRYDYNPTYLVGDRYQTTALIQWTCHDRPWATIPPHPQVQNQYSFWPSYDLQPGESVLFVTSQIDHPHSVYGQTFSSWRQLGQFTTHDRGRPLKTYAVFFGRK